MIFPDPRVFFIAAMLGAAQADSPAVENERSEITLDVVVRDGHGRLVRDLRPEEIHVTDDGIALQPLSLRFITPGTELASQKLPPRLITLMFEQSGPEGRAIARNGALALLTSAAGPNVYFAVLVIGTRAELVQPFTQDRAVVEKAIERVTLASRRKESKMDSTTSWSRVDNERGTDPMLYVILDGVVDPSVRLGLRAARFAPALQTLAQFARNASSLPGRKTLVYFSEGLQVSESQRQQFRGIVEAANRASLSIYPIDVSGLNYGLSSNTFANEMPVPATYGRTGLSVQTADITGAQNSRAQDLRMMESMDLDINASRTSLQSALLQLANGTGGFLTLNTNDVRKQARRIAEEALAYYQLTYLAPPAPLDGRFRPVSLSFDRPKLKVQTRNGYTAVPRVSGVPMQTFEVPLFKKLANEPGRRDFEHRTAVVPLRRVRDGIETAVVVESSIGNLQAEEDTAAGLLRMHGAVLAVIRDDKGAIVEHLARDDPFQAPVNRRDSLNNTPWPAELVTVLRRGTYTLETVMMDHPADRSSAGRRTFVVEPWEGGPHIAGLTYVRSVITAPPEARRAFQSGDRVVEPAFDVTLPGGKGSTATVYFLASGAAGVPMRVEIAVVKDGQAVAHGVVYEGNASTEMPLVSTVDAGTLPGGDYELRVKAIQAEKEFAASLPLKIAPRKVPGTAESGSSATEPIAMPATKPEEWNAPLPTAEQQKLLEAARATAMKYASHLPNFMCLQTTRRFEDPSGKQEWRQKDEYSEALTWQNGVESYLPVGERNRREHKETNLVRVSSAGEFGSVMRNIFDPQTQTDFRWPRSELVAGRNAEVFGYRIAKENSQYSVYYFGRHRYSIKPALRGVVTIDSITAEILHLELEADQLPDQMQVADHRVTVDYEVASVGGRDYLLPSSATLKTRVGPRLLVRNEIRFSGYRRFEAQTNINYGTVK